jgi:hypothetical protein
MEFVNHCGIIAYNEATDEPRDRPMLSKRHD